MNKVTIEITVDDENTHISIVNPSGKKDDPAFLSAVMMFSLFNDAVNTNSSDQSDKSGELNQELGKKQRVIRELESDLRKLQRTCANLYSVLTEAVEKYGKPGGPWNVPAEPGSWIFKAKEVLKEVKGEQ